MKVGKGTEQEFNIGRVIIPDAIQLDTYCFGRVSTSIYPQFCSDCLLKSLWWQLLYQSSLEYEVILLIQELLNKLLLIYIVLNGDEHFSDSKLSTLSLLKLDGFACVCAYLCVWEGQRPGEHPSTPRDSFLTGWSSSTWLHWLPSVPGMSSLRNVTTLSILMWTLRTKLGSYDC